MTVQGNRGVCFASPMAHSPQRTVGQRPVEQRVAAAVRCRSEKLLPCAFPAPLAAPTEVGHLCLAGTLDGPGGHAIALVIAAAAHYV